MAGYRVILLLFTFSSIVARAQDSKYFVYFKDKVGTPYSVNSPQQFLSSRSIARRQKENIAVIPEDLPVNPSYVNQVSATGARVYYSSKWWNGVLVEANEVELEMVNSLPFVSTSVLVWSVKSTSGGRNRVIEDVKSSTTVQPENQIQLAQIGLDVMHEHGYKGEGVFVGVFDSGFIGVNQTEPFSNLMVENRVKQTYNFVTNSEDIYQHNDHGTQVLSVMAAYSEGIYIGGAYNANYLLYVTEDISSEYRIEEFNWTIAAERADSAGVDVINSSLGYNEFTDPSMNYSTADLDGMKAIITQAARKAINKGIIVVSSAGNEGGNSWRFVTPPADAEGILAVGSVNAQGIYSGFSSQGPTEDNRIKPEVVAMGSGTSVIFANGSMGSSSGTSLSSPLVASLAVGVLQAFPQLTASQVYDAIINSAQQAYKPNNLVGYGLPHFTAIKNYIESNALQDNFNVYPNPVTGNYMTIQLKKLSVLPIDILIFDSQGKRIEEFSKQITWGTNPFEYDLSKLQPGLYIIRIQAGEDLATLKFVKL